MTDTTTHRSEPQMTHEDARRDDVTFLKGPEYRLSEKKAGLGLDEVTSMTGEEVADLVNRLERLANRIAGQCSRPVDEEGGPRGDRGLSGRVRDATARIHAVTAVGHQAVDRIEEALG